MSRYYRMLSEEAEHAAATYANMAGRDVDAIMHGVVADPVFAVDVVRKVYGIAYPMANEVAGVLIQECRAFV